MDINVIILLAGSLGLVAGLYYKWQFARVKIITVIDGDTFVAVSRKGKQFKIRLYAVDCPELMQPYGPEATQFVTNILLKRHVNIRMRSKDKYGRVVASVATPEGDLATLLVKSGLAHALPNHKLLKLHEYRARISRQGMWKQIFVQKPWNVKSRKHKGK